MPTAIVPYQVRFPPEVYDRLKERAIAERVSINALLNRIARDYVEDAEQ